MTDLLQQVSAFQPSSRKNKKLSDLIIEDCRGAGPEEVLKRLPFYFEQTGNYRAAHAIEAVLKNYAPETKPEEYPGAIFGPPVIRLTRRAALIWAASPEARPYLVRKTTPGGAFHSQWLKPPSYSYDISEMGRIPALDGSLYYERVLPSHDTKICPETLQTLIIDEEAAADRCPLDPAVMLTTAEAQTWAASAESADFQVRRRLVGVDQWEVWAAPLDFSYNHSEGFTDYRRYEYQRARSGAALPQFLFVADSCDGASV